MPTTAVTDTAAWLLHQADPGDWSRTALQDLLSTRGWTADAAGGADGVLTSTPTSPPEPAAWRSSLKGSSGSPTAVSTGS